MAVEIDLGARRSAGRRIPPFDQGSLRLASSVPVSGHKDTPGTWHLRQLRPLRFDVGIAHWVRLCEWFDAKPAPVTGVLIDRVITSAGPLDI